MNEVFDLTKNNYKSQKYLQYYLSKRKNYIVYAPENNKIKVTFTTDKNECYDCIYYYKTRDQVYEMIRNEQALDLQCTYVKDFDILEIGNPSKYNLNGLNASNSFWDGNIKFNGTIFENRQVSFHDAKFGNGEVSFDYAQFNGIDVSFVGAQFSNGLVSFLGAQFSNGLVCFDSAEFGNGEVCFDSAAFSNGYTSFNLVYFGDGHVNFDSTHFINNAVSYYNTTFGDGEVSFQGARFSDSNVRFENAQFNVGDVNFRFVQFGNSDVSFLNSSAQKLIFLNNTFSSHIDLRLKLNKELIVEDCIIEKTLKCESSIEYEKLSFLNTINLGHIYINWKVNNVLHGIQSGMKFGVRSYGLKGIPFTTEEKASQFRMLKENFHNIGYYDDEDAAFKAYMYYKTKNIKGFFEVYKQEKETGVAKRIYTSFCCLIRKFGYKLFGLIGGYGTRPVQLLGLSFMFTLFMGFIFSFFSKESAIFSKLIDGFYFSAITFLTIGYGYTVNEHWLVKILVSFEGFMGLFLMAYFTVSVVRKILR